MPAPDDIDVTRTTTSGAVRYTYRASRMTYLVYTLDCLADLGACSRAEFKAAWAPGWTGEDDAAIVAWGTLRERYSGMISDGERATTTPLPIPYHDRDVGTAIRVAGFGARDVADLGSRLSLFFGAAEVAHATQIAERFAGRLDNHWRASRSGVLASLDDFVALGERADVQALLGSIATFYAIGESGANQTFDLVSRPAGKGPTSAEQLGELAVVEVVPGEKAANRYSVITHEMFHAWFGASPISSQVALVERFVASGDPLAGPAWGLLDEVLATALGNGLVARLVDRADYDRRASTDQGLYSDPYIDRVAKALLPALEARIARKGTVFESDFVAEYLAAVHTAFPEGLPPIAYLRPMFAVTATPSDAAKRLMDLASPGSYENFSEIDEALANAQRLQGWGTAIFATRSELSRVAPLLSATVLATAKQRAGAFVLATKVRPIGVRFLFVADEDAQLAALVDAFAAVKGPLHEGVVVP